MRIQLETKRSSRQGSPVPGGSPGAPAWQLPRLHGQRWLAAALLWAILALLPAAPALATYKVRVEAPEALQDMLETHLDIARFRERADLSDDQFNFMVETVGDQVRALSATEGWFDPQTTVRVEGEGDGRIVYVSVDAGARTLIRNVDVDVTGPAATQAPEQVAAVRENWGLPPERPFRQADWDKAKDDALVALQSTSYYGATLARSQARIEPDERAADLTARYASGPAYVLGPLQVNGTRRYPEQIIRNVNPLAIGEAYHVERLLELQRAVQNQPYFSNVQVELGEPVATEVPDTVIAPVNVQVREYPTHRVTSGVGYSTDTGAQVEGRYSYLNMFNRAWVFDSQARIAQSRQYLFAELAMPPDSKTYRNSVYTSYDRTIDIESTDITSWRAGLKRSRSREKYDTTLSLDYYYDHLQPFGEPEQLSRALVPAYSWTRRDVDNPVFPRRGNVINTQLGVAMKGLLTDQTFFRAYGRIRQFIPVRKRDLIVARLELGADFTTGSAEKIPASLRFRAGGTDSIRGYGFQSIGTRKGASVLPAKYLGTASLEYQYWFKPDWGAAVFWDTGTATDNLDGVKLYHGVGVGARWRSPVGPVQLDVGYGIQDRKIRPHISLGVAF
ncbi:autotransporter assembly complex family protein [Cupriavidus respiraculi]|uniref:Translocation and assembly module subunit TamA n=1 Tax=Cupriavidus respiraculi TaxID=195930 RepID=A0ABN7YWD9_9BURK|nr:autotransporter assembly complex family protein [Cupriavidus respiraculi]CAG9177618.1 Translocation and assembly module subunit TamA [Cupriavidus respiraculi]